MRELSDAECSSVAGGLDQSLAAWGWAAVQLISEPRITVSGSRLTGFAESDWVLPDISDLDVRMVKGLEIEENK